MPGKRIQQVIGEAFIESLTGEQRITAPDDVAVYLTAFEAALEASVTGDEAAALIRSIS